ncbi:hypothetical protein [Natronosalvus vescus]|uniref:hypothetical protein n=1 Tax=Natronosalvus vescus TaxID=2953881 RepID=UPI002091D149|nr:hypothetical protein [Natronosalvus vescus]
MTGRLHARRNRLAGHRDWILFSTLLREEWRLHVCLFGGRRFYVFPLAVALLVGLAATVLTHSGYSSGRLYGGLTVTVVAFGLYSGTAAFAGSDMLENVFGELSLVLGTSSTLPLSRRRLLGHFLVKDALFYGLTIVGPLSLAVVPIEGLSVWTPLAVVMAWLSLFGFFLVGMAVTVLLIALGTRGLSARYVLAGGLMVAAGWWLLEPDVSVPSATALTEPIWVVPIVYAVAVGIGAFAMKLYDPSYTTPPRTYRRRFRRLESLPGSDPLVAKTLLDLSRSSGGLFKPIVSAAIILAVIAFLVGVVRELTGIEPAPGIFFGSVLGLSAFTTYNWLTQFDAVESYLPYPVSVEAVFRAKRIAFFLVGIPTMAGAYLVAIVWFQPAMLDAFVGFVLLIGLAIYYYGLTVYIAGFDPNEFLFDGVRFLTFTIGVTIVLLPTLIVGFASNPVTASSGAILAGAGVFVGACGRWLAIRAGNRWARLYRDGSV